MSGSLANLIALPSARLSQIFREKDSKGGTRRVRENRLQERFTLYLRKTWQGEDCLLESSFASEEDEDESRAKRPSKSIVVKEILDDARGRGTG